MKYVSIDLETTGLDPETCDIIEIGAVIDDLEARGEQGEARLPIKDLPKFHAYVVKESYQGEPYALSMHPKIFKRIATKEDGYLYLQPEEVGKVFGVTRERIRQIQAKALERIRKMEGLKKLKDY